ncbi:MAG: phosphatidate cytidylyltransferase [Chitinophagaceae bacterium]|nr:MAG: phosphatidate cytidylyltransferase [Chitinophagaceae bacterium]
MAFHWATFRTRALTAIVFAAVMLAGLFLNQWSFFLLFTLIHFGCFWEYLKLMGKIYDVRYHVYSKFGYMLLGYGLMLWFCDFRVFAVLGYGLRENFSLPVSLAGFIMLVAGIFMSARVTLRSFSGAALGIFYISLSWGLMMDLYQQSMNIGFPQPAVAGLEQPPMLYTMARNFIPFLIICGIWINDTMAYIVGSLIGRRPLSSISPKKTWEGTIGGILLAVGLLGWLYPLISFGRVETELAILVMIITLITAIAGTFGDLLESKLKRLAGVKDSGNIMPGHGGFMDRFDSLLIAVPFVWLFLHFLLEKTLNALI